MKILDIVKKVGLGIVREVVPGGGLLVDAVNELLPDDKKLPSNATGRQIGEAVASLPPDQRAAVIEKEFDVEITEIKESHSTVRAMLEHDAANPHSTRPAIARGAFQVVTAVTLIIVSVWAVGVLTDNAELVAAVMDGWPFVLSTVAPFVVLLQAYFGVLKQENRDKLQAASGSSPVGGIAGILSAIIKK